MIGKTISHYKIIEKIAEGSMGKVFLAEDTVLNREVALKFLPKKFSQNKIAKERFIREARAASVLDHPNICVIHEIGETDDNQLFISMNYYSGETLREKLLDGPLSVKETLKYITQIAKGLESAHEKGIIHCDIKPENILITEDGTPKIVDFGIAKVCCDVKLINNENASGTIAYMSPEQVENTNIDTRSDIWSLGVVFYEMLTGQVPFKDTFKNAIMYSIMNEEPESITSINSNIPPKLGKIVRQMLNKIPDQRYQTVTDLLADLKNHQKNKANKTLVTKKRKLAAIMFTDMVGYSALTQRNEVLALELLEEHRQILRPFIAKHDGHEIETIGDAFFIEFPSALEAVTCAIKIQKAFWKRNISVSESKHIKIRIGIHLGDVVHRGDNVLGDGVNIAARIEPLALSGGICVSEDVARQVKNKIEFSLKGLKTKHLKNIVLPVRVYAIMLPWLDELQYLLFRKKRKKIVLYLITIFSIILLTLIVIKMPDLELFNKSNILENSEWQNSIAVLPFLSLDRTEESEIFSEGIHEDILSHIAKIKNIKVIARTSVLQYKGTKKRIKEIAEELGVNTILEGSVRREGSKIRIVAQLIDADTEDHLWTEIYDRDYVEIFTIQSDVATNIASALRMTLSIEEKQAINEIPTDNLEAYEYFQKAQHGINSRAISIKLENFESEIKLFEKAIQLDPTFVMAYSSLAQAHIMVYWYHDQIPKNHLQSAKQALDNARNIDPNNSSVHLAEGYYYYYGYRDYDNALDKFQLALLKNPNNSDLLAAIGYVKRRQGKHAEALKYLKKSAEIDPQSSKKAHEAGLTARLLRNWSAAEKLLIRATSINPQNIWAYLDRIELAIEEKGDLLEGRMILENAYKYNNSKELIWVRLFDEYMNRNYQNAFNIISEYTAKNISDDSQVLFYKGRVALAMNQRGLATSYFDSLRILGLQGKRTTPENLVFHTYLYKAYAGLGMKEKFEKEYELLDSLLSFHQDVLAGTDRMLQKIECLIWLYEHDQAIDLIDKTLSIPSLLTVNRLKLSPIYDPIRENLRFQKVLRKYEE